MNTESNTIAGSGTTTSENEITDIWNSLDVSFAQQSDQNMKEYDETNGSQELTEEEIEEFLRKEQEAIADGNNAYTNSKYTPQIGMLFNTREDAHHFFSFYGFIAGFEVVVTHTTRTTSKKRNNEIYKQEMRCHRYGKESKKKTPEEEEHDMMIHQAKGKGPKRKTKSISKGLCK